MPRLGWLALGLAALLVAAPSPLRAPASANQAAAVSSVDACQQGQALEALGRYGAATTIYLKGLANSDTEQCAREALDALNTTGLVCSSAQALEDLERTTEANTAYRKILEQLPNSSCARAGVRRTDREDVWSQLGTASKDLGSALAALALALLALGLVVWALLLIGTHLPGVRRVWPFRSFQRVRVQIKDLNDSAVTPSAFGASTTGMLRARLRSDAANARVDQASGSASASDALDGLAEVSSQAKIVVALIGVLKAWLPDRDWVVTGELQAKGDDGEGLSLAIENGGAFVDFSAFWARRLAGPGDPEGAEAYRRLTVPAAGWLGHHVATANAPQDRLSTDSQSWALTQCALYWYDLGDRETARAFYERALGRDGDNIAALANLGNMDAEDGNPDTGFERLKRAIALLEQR